MMRVIVDHRHAAPRTEHLESPFRPAKFAQSFANCEGRRPDVMTHRRRRDRVQHIVPTGNSQADFREKRLAVKKSKPHAFCRRPQIRRPPIGAVSQRKCLDLSETRRRRDARRFAVTSNNQVPVRRQSADEFGERLTSLTQVAEEIEMIRLDPRQHDMLRTERQKILLIFTALDHE